MVLKSMHLICSGVRRRGPEVLSFDAQFVHCVAKIMPIHSLVCRRLGQSGYSGLERDWQEESRTSYSGSVVGGWLEYGN